MEDRVIFDDVEYLTICDNTSWKEIGEYTDKIICAKQGSNMIVFNKKDLQELERVIGAKFKM